MQKKELVNIVVNSVVLSHTLSDCLEIMIEQGFLFHEVKAVSKKYQRLIEKNNDRIFRGLTEERAIKVSDEIDQLSDIFKLLSVMSFEEKAKVLESLKSNPNG